MATSLLAASSQDRAAERAESVRWNAMNDRTSPRGPVNARSDRTGWLQSGAFEIASDVYRIPLPLPHDGLRAVNVYAVREPAGWALVDCGWRHPETVAALRAGLAQLRADGTAITKVLATHSHYDHYGLTAYVREHSGAEIMLGRVELDSLAPALDGGDWAQAVAHRATWLRRHGAQEVLSEIEAQEEQEDFESVRAESRWESPDRVLDAGDHIVVGGRTLEAILTPGHSRGHIMYLDRANRLLFAGDHVLPHITPSVGFEPFSDGKALERFLASLRAVRDLDVDVVLPGHGPVFDDLAVRVDELLAHHDTRLGASHDALARPGVATAFDVAARLTWTRHERLFSELDALNRLLATGETVTHLEYLADHGRATRHDSPERITYTPN
jgi:glyoxylase-like metal-dependent hydrolase (beta-lactamase superfamily II)